MVNCWFARPDYKHASRWAFTPISWKGYVAIFGPIHLSVAMTGIILDRLPQGGITEFWPIFQISGVTLSTLSFLLVSSWFLFRSRIDWDHYARDYDKGKLISDVPNK